MKLRIIIHDIRSTHNVGSILRSSDAFGVEKVYIGGYSPYPALSSDDRLPHLQTKQTARIAKTALGAEKTVPIERYDTIATLIESLRSDGFQVVGLEQDPRSTPLVSFVPSDRVALIIGREVEGIEESILKLCDKIIEIPMRGQKESLNVSVAAAIALYQFSLNA